MPLALLNTLDYYFSPSKTEIYISASELCGGSAAL